MVHLKNVQKCNIGKQEKERVNNFLKLKFYFPKRSKQSNNNVWFT
jgi:hypothetical protein